MDGKCESGGSGDGVDGGGGGECHKGTNMAALRCESLRANMSTSHFTSLRWRQQNNGSVKHSWSLFSFFYEHNEILDLKRLFRFEPLQQTVVEVLRRYAAVQP